MELQHGLMNKGKSRNCFINSLLQSFCNLNSVRSYILSEDISHTCSDICLYCEIKVIPIQLTIISLVYSDTPQETENIRKAMKAQIGLKETTVSSEFNQNQRGCILETFDIFLDYYHSNHMSSLQSRDPEVSSCGNGCLSHSVFGFTTAIKGSCCTAIEEPQDNLLLYIYGGEFINNFRLIGKEIGLDRIIRATIENESDYRRYSECSCKNSYVLSKQIISAPKVLAVAILWAEETLKKSHKLLNIINDNINLLEIFPPAREIERFLYKFRGMICYSRHFKHYLAVFSNDSYTKWNFLSDSLVKTFKSWSLLCLGLRIFRITPVLIFYEQCK